jgi:hypothetical protein
MPQLKRFDKEDQEEEADGRKRRGKRSERRTWRTNYSTDWNSPVTGKSQGRAIGASIIHGSPDPKDRFDGECPVGKDLVGVPDTALPDPADTARHHCDATREVTPSIIGGRLELLDSESWAPLGRHDACAASPLVKWYQQ